MKKAEAEPVRVAALTEIERAMLRILTPEERKQLLLAGIAAKQEEHARQQAQQQAEKGDTTA